jgi:perosamine synthetase
MYNAFVEFVKSLYPGYNPVPLHAPVFFGKEKEYLFECIDSTFVSYVGKYVTKFEEMTAEFTGAKYAIAIVNGTAALQVALQISGVGYGDEVITQALTFVATANAISQCGATPIFIDVDKSTMGMSPEKLLDWLIKNTKLDKSQKILLNKKTNRKISAIVPMHTFGFPCKINEIIEVAEEYNLPVIEDSAESIGSYFNGKHTGTFGLAGTLSFNGNKTITTGGGGMIITDNKDLAKKAMHLTTTARLAHKYEYIHDEIAYNFRLPNINAAIGVAQMEKINTYLSNKRETALKYQEYFKNEMMEYFVTPEDTKANFWLNVILLKNLSERDKFLNYTNDSGVMTRPIWRLINKLDMYSSCETGNLDNSYWFESRAVCLPSGFRI